MNNPTRLGLALVLGMGSLFPTAADAQVLERSNTNWGTSRVFSYSVTTTYGVNTSVQASPNVKTKAEATLNLKEDSVVTNTAGDIGGNTSAVIVTTPGGTTANLSITANNEFYIDNGQASKRRQNQAVRWRAPKRNVSATASHSLTLTITNNEQAFYNTLRENFEGAL